MIAVPKELGAHGFDLANGGEAYYASAAALGPFCGRHNDKEASDDDQT